MSLSGDEQRIIRAIDFLSEEDVHKLRELLEMMDRAKSLEELYKYTSQFDSILAYAEKMFEEEVRKGRIRPLNKNMTREVAWGI